MPVKGLQACLKAINVTYLNFYSTAPDGTDRLAHEVYIHLSGVLLQLSQDLERKKMTFFILLMSINLSQELPIFTPLPLRVITVEKTIERNTNRDVGPPHVSNGDTFTVVLCLDVKKVF